MTVYEWDDWKAKENLHKHGVSFEDAREALEDPDLTYLPDRIYDGELRHHAVGRLSSDLLLLMVAHTVRGNDNEEIVRIISARRAEGWERQLYRSSSSR